MTTYLSDEERGALARAVAELIESARLYRSCLSCVAFDEQNEACSRAGGQRPPARTIAMGCPAYVSDPPF